MTLTASIARSVTPWMMCDHQREREFGGTLAGCDSAIRNDAHWWSGWFPIMDADGNKLVMDLDPAPGGTPGQIFTWSNTGSTPQRVVASPYRDWLAAIAETLAKRRFRLDEYGGIWIGGPQGE